MADVVLHAAGLMQRVSNISRQQSNNEGWGGLTADAGELRPSHPVLIHRA